jgi:hypothetical protein
MPSNEIYVGLSIENPGIFPVGKMAKPWQKMTATSFCRAVVYFQTKWIHPSEYFV